MKEAAEKYLDLAIAESRGPRAAVGRLHRELVASRVRRNWGNGPFTRRERAVWRAVAASRKLYDETVFRAEMLFALSGGNPAEIEPIAHKITCEFGEPYLDETGRPKAKDVQAPPLELKHCPARVNLVLAAEAVLGWDHIENFTLMGGG